MEDKDEEVVEEGRGENRGWLSIHFQYNQLQEMSTETTIVDQLFTIISKPVWYDRFHMPNFFEIFKCRRQ